MADPPVLVVTTDELPGYEIRAILGEVIGVTVRTQNPYAEGVRGPLGSHLNPRMVKALAHWREVAVARMALAARERGANAVVGMRFDHRTITQWAEICAYGTAVVAVRSPAMVSARPAAG